LTIENDKIVDEDSRYDSISKKYLLLSKKLQEQVLIHEAEDAEMLKSLELVNKRLLESASKLQKPPVSEPSPLDNPKADVDYYSNLERRRARKQLFKDQNNQYKNDLSRCFISKKGL